MKFTVSIELVQGDPNNAELIAWLNAALAGGEPVKPKKARKPRKPLTDEEKAAFRARMVKGQQDAAIAKGGNGGSADLDAEEDVQPDPEKIAAAEELGEELAKGSKSTAAKKPASKRKPAAKKKAPTKTAAA